MDKREFIAMNVATLFNDGDVVNLGVGIPSLSSTFIPPDKTVLFHTENGAVGCGKSNGYIFNLNSREDAIISRELWGDENGNYRTQHRDLINASGESITLIPGAFCCDTTMSFAIARGGHLDATVLGALQVDQERNLANWKIPGKRLNGMGGAMDIVSGAKRVVIAMEHCTKNGDPKILKKCTLPLTATNCVDMIVTELCMIECKEGDMRVVAIAPHITKNEIIKKTEVELKFAEELKVMCEC